MATTTVCYVLVTPKAVEIEPKGLVEAGGTRYVVPGGPHAGRLEE